MNRYATCFASFTAILCVLATAAAQNPFDGLFRRSTNSQPQLDATNRATDFVRGMSYTPPVKLLMRREVGDDLKLSKTQKTYFHEMQNLQADEIARRDRFSRTLNSYRMHDAYDLGAIMGLMNEIDGLVDSCNKKAVELLNDGQRKRYEELRIQAMGALAVVDTEVLTALALTGRQKEILILVCEDNYAAFIQYTKSTRAPSIQKFRDAHDADFQANVAVILTEKQTAQLKQMAGKPCKGLNRIDL